MEIVQIEKEEPDDRCKPKHINKHIKCHKYPNWKAEIVRRDWKSKTRETHLKYNVKAQMG